MTHTETIDAEGLLATLLAEPLNRHNVDPSEFYKKEKPYSESSRRAYARWHGKCSAAFYQARGRGHYPIHRRQCVRALKSSRVLAQLEEAANQRNEFAFVTALESVRLTNRTESQVASIIKLALKAGAYLAARHVAEYGVARYPHSDELQQHFLALAPPQRASRIIPHNPAFQANRQWLNDHALEYNGKWVALRAGELLGASNSFDELFNRIGRSKDTLFTRA
jgi:hypothetical protein